MYRLNPLIFPEFGELSYNIFKHSSALRQQQQRANRQEWKDSCVCMAFTIRLGWMYWRGASPKPHIKVCLQVLLNTTESIWSKIIRDIAHKRCYTTFFTWAVALPKTCKHTLIGELVELPFKAKWVQSCRFDKLKLWSGDWRNIFGD